MKKRLITKDYEEIVFESLKIPKTDYHNYYLNIVEEKYDYNHNIVANLTQAVSKWITWYNSKRYGKVVKAKISDGSIQYVDENQAWETDKNGKMTPIDLEKKSISLFLGFGIKIHVNNAFFDNLIDELSTIQEIIDFKNSVIEFENKLPESIKNKTLKIPMPVGFDFKEIKERFELIKASTNQHLGNIINEPNKTQETIELRNLASQHAVSKEQVKKTYRLSEIIRHEKSQVIVEKIKIKYKNIKGKNLKLLFLAFQELELLPLERFAQKFHDYCNNEFDWDIASYNAMNKYQYNSKIDEKVKESMITFISSIT